MEKFHFSHATKSIWIIHSTSFNIVPAPWIRTINNLIRSPLHFVGNLKAIKLSCSTSVAAKAIFLLFALAVTFAGLRSHRNQRNLDKTRAPSESLYTLDIWRWCWQNFKLLLQTLFAFEFDVCYGDICTKKNNSNKAAVTQKF